VRTDGHRRSENFEDRGAGGRGPRGGGGAAPRLLQFVVRRFGLPGLLVAGLGLAGVWLLAPPSIQRAVFGAVLGGAPAPGGAAAGGSVCEASPGNAQACDFSRVVLASTEDVWTAQFAQGRVPTYRQGGGLGPYREPTLVVFTGGVRTNGCGSASSSSGPFYCPADQKLYIDPAFYDVMARQLRAPGDFAQAYVIAHEVGHHVQNLIGSMGVGVRGETEEQTSVRVELQADCLAGVWGHTARASLAITDEDLAEATQAAHAIGDDALGHRDRARFTHGSSAQRIRWFRRGFDSGDPRQCDTFAVRDHAQL
jgi:predicted metalloprotease